MAKGFKLSGTHEERFSQLEKIIPRMINRPAGRIMTLPPTVLCFHLKDLSSPRMCILFAGKLEKLCYSVSSIKSQEKNPKLGLVYSIISGNSTTSVPINSKKLSNIITLDTTILDGDVLKVESVDDTSYEDLLISILYTPKFTSSKMVPKEELYEGI
jgi:hypothetical protein